MLIEEKALQHWIDNFYGYGSWQARFWFVGFEENGGDLPEEVADKLAYFYNAHPPASPSQLCDLRALLRHVTARMDGPKAHLFSTLYDYRFGNHAVQHGVWKNLIAFMHGYRNETLPDLLAYQKNSFAVPALQEAAVIPLYPLPAHNHAWYYSWLDLPQRSFLKTRTQYQEHVYPRRMETLLNNIATYKPQLVLMYAMDNIQMLKETVQARYPSAKFRMEKAVKLQIPQHHHADLNGTRLLITTQLPALRHNRVETGFDWELFGKTVKAGE